MTINNGRDRGVVYYERGNIDECFAWQLDTFYYVFVRKHTKKSSVFEEKNLFFLKKKIFYVHVFPVADNIEAAQGPLRNFKPKCTKNFLKSLIFFFPESSPNTRIA